MSALKPWRPLDAVERKYLALLIQGLPKSQFSERLGCTRYAIKEIAFSLLFKFGVLQHGCHYADSERVLIARILGTDGPPCEQCERRRAIIEREIAHPLRRWAWTELPPPLSLSVPDAAAAAWERLKAIEQEAAELRDVIQLELAREAAAA